MAQPPDYNNFNFYCDIYPPDEEDDENIDDIEEIY